MPYREPTSGEVFRRRLAVYLTGVAIGLVMLGIFKSQRAKMIQQRQQQQAEQQAQPEPSPPNPDSAQEP